MNRVQQEFTLSALVGLRGVVFDWDLIGGLPDDISQ